MGLADEINEYREGETPLMDEDKEGLLLDYVETRGELDINEQWNIENAILWYYWMDTNYEEILTVSFIKKLHFMMFDVVWDWAGKFRKSDKNIGVDWRNINMDLHNLLNDTKYWIEHKTFPDDELVMRFKHRLVLIHCFPNGNGRHSRLMSDILIHHGLGHEYWYTWHRSETLSKQELRDMYIDVLRKADKGNFQPLIAFARASPLD